MNPKRIQRKRVKGWKMPPNTVYVGRPTKWGNPFKVGEPYRVFTEEGIVQDHKKAVSLFNLYRVFAVNKDVAYANKIQEELKGKNLACWCPLDKPCHADVLLEIANEDNTL